MRKLFLIPLFFCYLISAKANNPGYLGISIRDFANNKIAGAQVLNVFDDGAAKQYGLQENDIITAINNNKVLKQTDLTTQLVKYNWGDKVKLDIIRNSEFKSLEIYLGYKGTIRTYNVQKSINSVGELWLFSDDNTTIQINKENNLVNISKKNKNNLIEKWSPNNDLKNEEIPQYFLDVDDKMFCINRIKDDQAKRNCTIKDIIYIKEIKENKTIETNKKEDLQPTLFSIFPNPSNGVFSLNIKSKETGNATILVFDITGRVIVAENIMNFEGNYLKQFNLENEPKGAYLMQIKIGDILTTKKFLLH